MNARATDSIPAPRLPPHHIESEQSVLGALLVDPAALDLVADVLRESDFWLDAHRRIYRHITRMVLASQSVDVVTVAESIDRSNETDQTGGLAYLAEIANATPSAANVRGYALIVADRALRRALLAAALETEREASGAAVSGSSAVALVDAAQARLTALADARLSANEPEPIQPFLAEVITDIEALAVSGKPLAGLSTGFIELDNRTTGLHPGNLIVIAGRPAMGKTALALNIAEHCVLAGGTALVFSMEMTRRELAARNLAAIGGIKLDVIRTGKLTDEDWDKASMALGKLHEANLIVDETGGLTIGQLRAKARRVRRKMNRLDLVVVDYLQLMEADRSGENRNAEITAISRGLKAIAKELQCPLIALSQLSRKVEERTNKRPIMSDLRESGAIEQDADLVLMMYREEYYKPDTPDRGLAEVIIGKQRNGPTGDIRLHFDGEYSRFRNLAFGEHVRQVAREANRKGKGYVE